MSIDKLLKNANTLQAGTGENLTTHLYSETTKPEIYKSNKTRAYFQKSRAHLSC